MAVNDNTPASRLPLILCLVSALLPFFAVQLSYLLAADAGSVPWCFPYIDSCTSISATGRSGTASYIFRGAMLPASVFIAGFWWLHWRWIRDLSRAPATRRQTAMLALGLLACVGLVLYVSVLGEAGSLWRAQRRVGTILFFAFTYLSQLLLAAELRHLPAVLAPRASAVGHWQLRVCMVMLCIGIFSVLIQSIDEDWHDAIEDAVEWQLALLLQVNFLLCAHMWTASHWALQFRQRERGTEKP